MDDEGSVEYNRIRLGVKNESFLADIIKILQNKTPLKDCVKLNRKKGIPTLEITSKGLKWYQGYIGFTHPQKREDLNFYLKIKRRGPGLTGNTKMKILQSLLEREKTTREISRDIKASPLVVLSHIKGQPSTHCSLEDAGLVQRVKNDGNSFVWKLTERSKIILKTS